MSNYAMITIFLHMYLFSSSCVFFSIIALAAVPSPFAKAEHELKNEFKQGFDTIGAQNNTKKKLKKGAEKRNVRVLVNQKKPKSNSVRFFELCGDRKAEKSMYFGHFFRSIDAMPMLFPDPFHAAFRRCCFAFESQFFLKINFEQKI